ncbi:hypothetical protein GNI_097400, partial [Gregarina niphandrodes]
MAALRFTDAVAGGVGGAAAVVCAHAIMDFALRVADRLDIAPLVAQCRQGAAVAERAAADLLVLQLREAYRVSLGRHAPARRGGLRDTRNVYGWPSVQLILADKLRRIAEFVGEPTAALWLALVGFAAVATAFDARTQAVSQRTLAAREAALGVQDRNAVVLGVAAQQGGTEAPRQLTEEVIEAEARQGTEHDQVAELVGRSDLVAVGLRSRPWLVPPAVTFVSKGEGAAARFLLRCSPGGVGLSVRRLPKNVVLKYAHFGGLSQGHYVPNLLSLEPRVARRVTTMRHRSKIIRAAGAARETGDEAFLFQPWTRVAGSNDVAWVVNELHSVCVRVRNPLSTDLLLDGCKLETVGAPCQCQPLTVGLPPANYDMLFECLI